MYGIITDRLSSFFRGSVGEKRIRSQQDSCRITAFTKVNADINGLLIRIRQQYGLDMSKTMNPFLTTPNDVIKHKQKILDGEYDPVVIDARESSEALATINNILESGMTAYHPLPNKDIILILTHDYEPDESIQSRLGKVFKDIVDPPLLMERCLINSKIEKEEIDELSKHPSAIGVENGALIFNEALNESLIKMPLVLEKDEVMPRYLFSRNDVNLKDNLVLYVDRKTTVDIFSGTIELCVDGTFKAHQPEIFCADPKIAWKRIMIVMLENNPDISRLFNYIRSCTTNTVLENMVVVVGEELESDFAINFISTDLNSRVLQADLENIAGSLKDWSDITFSDYLDPPFYLLKEKEQLFQYIESANKEIQTQYLFRLVAMENFCTQKSPQFRFDCGRIGLALMQACQQGIGKGLEVIRQDKNFILECIRMMPLLTCVKKTEKEMLKIIFPDFGKKFLCKTDIVNYQQFKDAIKQSHLSMKILYVENCCLNDVRNWINMFRCESESFWIRNENSFREQMITCCLVINEQDEKHVMSEFLLNLTPGNAMSDILNEYWHHMKSLGQLKYSFNSIVQAHISEFLCSVLNQFNTEYRVNSHSLRYLLKCMDIICNKIKNLHMIDNHSHLGVSVFVTILHSICPNEENRADLLMFLTVYFEHIDIKFQLIDIQKIPGFNSKLDGIRQRKDFYLTEESIRILFSFFMMDTLASKDFIPIVKLSGNSGVGKNAVTEVYHDITKCSVIRINIVYEQDFTYIINQELKDSTDEKVTLVLDEFNLLPVDIQDVVLNYVLQTWAHKVVKIILTVNPPNASFQNRHLVTDFVHSYLVMKNPTKTEIQNYLSECLGMSDVETVDLSSFREAVVYGRIKADITFTKSTQHLDAMHSIQMDWLGHLNDVSNETNGIYQKIMIKINDCVDHCSPRKKDFIARLLIRLILTMDISFDSVCNKVLTEVERKEINDSKHRKAVLKDILNVLEDQKKEVSISKIMSSLSDVFVEYSRLFDEDKIVDYETFTKIRLIEDIDERQLSPYTPIYEIENFRDFFIYLHVGYYALDLSIEIEESRYVRLFNNNGKIIIDVKASGIYRIWIKNERRENKLANICAQNMGFDRLFDRNTLIQWVTQRGHFQISGDLNKISMPFVTPSRLKKLKFNLTDLTIVKLGGNDAYVLPHQFGDISQVTICNSDDNAVPFTIYSDENGIQLIVIKKKIKDLAGCYLYCSFKSMTSCVNAKDLEQIGIITKEFEEKKLPVMGDSRMAIKEFIHTIDLLMERHPNVIETIRRKFEIDDIFGENSDDALMLYLKLRIIQLLSMDETGCFFKLNVYMGIAAHEKGCFFGVIEAMGAGSPKFGIQLSKDHPNHCFVTDLSHRPNALKSSHVSRDLHDVKINQKKYRYDNVLNMLCLLSISLPFLVVGGNIAYFFVIRPDMLDNIADPINSVQIENVMPRFFWFLKLMVQLKNSLPTIGSRIEDLEIKWTDLKERYRNERNLVDKQILSVSIGKIEQQLKHLYEKRQLTLKEVLEGVYGPSLEITRVDKWGFVQPVDTLDSKTLKAVKSFCETGKLCEIRPTGLYKALQYSLTSYSPNKLLVPNDDWPVEFKELYYEMHNNGNDTVISRLSAAVGSLDLSYRTKGNCYQSIDDVLRGEIQQCDCKFNWGIARRFNMLPFQQLRPSGALHAVCKQNKVLKTFDFTPKQLYDSYEDNFERIEVLSTHQDLLHSSTPPEFDHITQRFPDVNFWNYAWLILPMLAIGKYILIFTLTFLFRDSNFKRVTDVNSKLSRDRVRTNPTSLNPEVSTSLEGLGSSVKVTLNEDDRYCVDVLKYILNKKKLKVAFESGDPERNIRQVFEKNPIREYRAIIDHLSKIDIDTLTSKNKEILHLIVKKIIYLFGKDLVANSDRNSIIVQLKGFLGQRCNINQLIQQLIEIENLLSGSSKLGKKLRHYMLNLPWLEYKRTVKPLEESIGEDSNFYCESNKCLELFISGASNVTSKVEFGSINPLLSYLKQEPTYSLNTGVSVGSPKIIVFAGKLLPEVTDDQLCRQLCSFIDKHDVLVQTNAGIHIVNDFKSLLNILTDYSDDILSIEDAKLNSRNDVKVINLGDIDINQ